MALTFSNRRMIPAGDYQTSAPWLAGIRLSPLDRAQLLAVVQLFNPKIGEAEMLGGDAGFFSDHVQAFAETSVEWWDVGDDELRFQLWLCNADGGYLFDAGTTTLRANVIQWDFDIDELLPSDVRGEVAHAARRAVEAAKGSMLAQINFDEANRSVVTVETVG